MEHEWAMFLPELFNNFNGCRCDGYSPGMHFIHWLSGFLKESHGILIIGYQHVFGLPVVIQHHLVGFPSDS